MIERVVIVPDKDNAGKSLARERLFIEGSILAIAGGFTKDKVRGAWVGDDGRVYRDTSSRYTLALSEEQDKQIAEKLPVWTMNLRQEALFTSTREVEVSFVTAPKVAA